MSGSERDGSHEDPSESASRKKVAARQDNRQGATALVMVVAMVLSMMWGFHEPPVSSGMFFLRTLGHMLGWATCTFVLSNLYGVNRGTPGVIYLWALLNLLAAAIMLILGLTGVFPPAGTHEAAVVIAVLINILLFF